jgi:hypothetical protein
MNQEKIYDGVLQAGDSVAGGITDLYQRRISKFSCDRDGELGTVVKTNIEMPVEFSSELLLILVGGRCHTT